MHYFVYLDEFGHIGPFVSRQDKKYNTSPVFGLGGIALPLEEIRYFSSFFYQLKCELLSWELSQATVPAYQWEKKGAALYTTQNVQKYKELRRATFRIMNRIKRGQGFVFYYGLEKWKDQTQHSPEGIYLFVLRKCIRRLNAFCYRQKATFTLLLDAIDSDQNGARRKFRQEGIRVAGSEMFGIHNGLSCRYLMEPPYQLESHLFQNLQCADWFCGLLNRYLSYKVLPDQYPDYGIFEYFFASRLRGVVKASKLVPASTRALPEVLPTPSEEMEAMSQEQSLICRP